MKKYAIVAMLVVIGDCDTCFGGRGAKRKAELISKEEMAETMPETSERHDISDAELQLKLVNRLIEASADNNLRECRRLLEVERVDPNCCWQPLDITAEEFVAFTTDPTTLAPARLAICRMFRSRLSVIRSLQSQCGDFCRASSVRPIPLELCSEILEYAGDEPYGIYLPVLSPANFYRAVAPGRILSPAAKRVARIESVNAPYLNGIDKVNFISYYNARFALYTPLVCAAIAGNEEVVSELLKRYHANPCINGSGNFLTQFEYARILSSPRIVQMLLDARVQAMPDGLLAPDQLMRAIGCLDMLPSAAMLNNLVKCGANPTVALSNLLTSFYLRGAWAGEELNNKVLSHSSITTVLMLIKRLYELGSEPQMLREEICSCLKQNEAPREVRLTILAWSIIAGLNLRACELAPVIQLGIAPDPFIRYCERLCARRLEAKSAHAEYSYPDLTDFIRRVILGSRHQQMNCLLS